MTRRTVYLHGLPGSPAELSLAGSGSAWLDADLVLAPDRNAKADGGAALARQIAQWAGNDPVDLGGFSLGGAAALRLAPLLSEQVARIELIAPAAVTNSRAR
jgi:pimeloyl-ACP methyl ester carboxylesterase